MFLTHIYVWVTTVLFPPVTQPPPPNNTIQVMITITRLGVDKVKPKGWFKYSLLFHQVLVYMGDLQLVHPALNLSTLDAGILIIVQ